MISSCKWCGGYHDKKVSCGKKPSRFKRLTKEDKFRSGSQWRRKSIEIRQRDKGLCQICLRLRYNTQNQYTFDTIEVHHIIKLVNNMTRGLDNLNLISLCKYHHAMADNYEIPQKELHEIAAEQERSRL